MQSHCNNFVNTKNVQPLADQRSYFSNPFKFANQTSVHNSDHPDLTTLANACRITIDN